MSDDATAPPPKTPARPQSGNHAVGSLKSTSNTVGSAVMSDNIAKAPPVQVFRASERLASKDDSKMCTSNHFNSKASKASSSKKIKINDAEQEDDKKKKHANVQNGLYAAEKFAAHVALQHVMCSVVNDDMLYIWHIDRQRVIQHSGFNLVQDLSHFLVFLLIMHGESCRVGWTPVTYIQEENQEENQEKSRQTQAGSGLGISDMVWTGRRIPLELIYIVRCTTYHVTVYVKCFRVHLQYLISLDEFPATSISILYLSKSQRSSRSSSDVFLPGCTA